MIYTTHDAPNLSEKRDSIQRLIAQWAMSFPQTNPQATNQSNDPRTTTNEWTRHWLDWWHSRRGFAWVWWHQRRHPSRHLHWFMNTITLDTSPPVEVKLWEKSKRYFWRYDYEGCPKNGPFKSKQQAVNDARTFSAQLWHNHHPYLIN
jgi:hypothetical protein